MSVNDFRTERATIEFEVQQGEDAFNATYIFGNEDHTLGNSLRHILMMRPETEFCGYSVPHPYEPKLNIRLQTRGKPAIEVLKDGLRDLAETANILDDVFLESMSRKTKPATK